MISESTKFPITLQTINGRLHVVLFILPRSNFKDPFFIDSLAKYFPNIKPQIKPPSEDEMLARPVHYDDNDQKITAEPIEDYIAAYNGESKKKFGFIFHMSRCGSTLVTQMLSRSDRFFVLSEPSIINAVLDPALDISESDRESLLKACIIGLGECSPENCEQIIIKFRSWNTLYMDKVIKQFQETSWLFVHRDGLEILSSVLEQPPGWLRSKHMYAKYFSSFLNLTEEEIQSMPDDEYALRMLGAFCEKVKNIEHNNCIFVDYKNLKSDFLEITSHLWNINFTEKEVQQMNEIGKMRSKDLTKVVEFEDDSEFKKAKATERQQQLSELFVEKLRSSLDNINNEHGREIHEKIY